MHTEHFGADELLESQPEVSSSIFGTTYENRQEKGGLSGSATNYPESENFFQQEVP
jgi:hypothetical protein